jgi:tight adherence protein C
VPPFASVLLGVAWGTLAAVPLTVRARRVTVAARLSPLPAGRDETRAPVLDRARSWVPRGLDAAGPVGRVVRGTAGRLRGRRADAALQRDLPVTIDLLAVAVGAGCTPYLAVDVAAHWAPSRLATAFASVMRACALGVAFDTALGDTVRVTPRLGPVADALLVSDRSGAPVGPALARLASEERAALRRRAEAHARRVPVRLLFPLVFLVLPAFVLLTVVPGLAAGLARL